MWLVMDLGLVNHKMQQSKAKTVKNYFAFG